MLSFGEQTMSSPMPSASMSAKAGVEMCHEPGFFVTKNGPFVAGLESPSRSSVPSWCHAYTVPLTS